MMINKLFLMTQKFSFLLVLLVLALFVIINFLSSQFFFRLDVTEEKVYTLSNASKEIVKNIEEPITLKFYFSSKNEQVSQTYRNYAKQVEELLKEYVQISPEKLVLEVLDPQPDSDEEQAARSDGINGIDIRNSAYKFYLGLSLQQKEKKERIVFFDLRKEESLEYDITQQIYKVSNNQKLKIGIMSSLNIEGAPAQNIPAWAAYSELSQFYEVVRFDPTHEIPEDIDILIALHPKELLPNPFLGGEVLVESEYAIEQFLLRSGKVILIVDPFMRSDESSLSRGIASSSSTPILFKHWGIEYDATSVIAEPDKAFVVRLNSGSVPYFLWHSLNSNSFANIPSLESIEDALFAEPGGFHYQGKELKFQELITSGEKTGTYKSNLIISNGDPNQINKNISLENKKYTYAGVLTGNFTAAFEKRIDSDKEFKNEHLTEGEGNILIMSDGDWLSNGFSVRQLRILNQVIVQPLNDNLGMFLNLVEYMAGSETLYEIRTRGRFARPFEKIQDLERKAQQEYKKVENNLQAELKSIREQLSKLQPKDGKVVITVSQKKQIENFKKQEKDTFIKLREIRKLLRQDIENLKSLLTALNILLVPILVLLAGFFIFHKRHSIKIKK